MKHILHMAWVATSGMTLFSYFLSLLFKEKFLETMLLNQLVFFRKKEEMKNHPAGFVIHYGVGTFFSTLYYGLWKHTAQQPGWQYSCLLGFFNGLIGVAGWHLFLKRHPCPPKIRHKKFYVQLLAAHVVFGVLNARVYKNKYNGNE